MPAETFDIVRLMVRRMHMSEHAAICALAHGHVYLDDRCIGVNERILNTEESRGKIVRARGRTYTLGSRPIEHFAGTLF